MFSSHLRFSNKLFAPMVRLVGFVAVAIHTILQEDRKRFAQLNEECGECYRVVPDSIFQRQKMKSLGCIQSEFSIY